MAYVKSEQREAAEQRVAGARVRLEAAAAAHQDGAVLAEALRANDHVAALGEVRRLGGEVAAAWKALDEAAGFLAFSIMTDVAEG